MVLYVVTESTYDVLRTTLSYVYKAVASDKSSYVSKGT